MRNGYELFAGRSFGESATIQSEGLFHTLAAAQEHAVPGHPDEWVYVEESDQHGHWFHGGGNEAGQYFVIRRVVDGLTV